MAGKISWILSEDAGIEFGFVYLVSPWRDKYFPKFYNLEKEWNFFYTFLTRLTWHTRCGSEWITSSIKASK